MKCVYCLYLVIIWFWFKGGGTKKKQIDFVLINNNILFSYLNSHADILLFFSLLLLIIFFTLFLSKAHSSSSFVHLSLVSKRQRTKLLKMTGIGSMFLRHTSYLNSASFSASRLRLSHSKFWRLHSFSLTTFPPSLVSCKFRQNIIFFILWVYCCVLACLLSE